MQLFANSDFAPPPSLRLRRDRAERILNGLRAAVVFLLTAAALMYAPHLSRSLNIANVLVLAPTLGWTVAQYLIWYKRDELPDWLSAINPVISWSGNSLPQHHMQIRPPSTWPPVRWLAPCARIWSNSRAR